MGVSYNKLWKLLIDRKISKADLRKMAGILPNTMTRMNKDETISLEVLGRICEVLKVDFGDIISHIPDNKGE